MHEMRTIATGDPVAWCVGLSVTHLRPAKQLDGSRSCLCYGDSWGIRHIVSDGGPDPLTGKEEVG